ncbi:MAG: hypothetical protein TREMPRED_000637 [Tremellales sp. Tagirdzhanova-0007]|nr:MAG: hypothetical protein TREMPRED_000637 [Tremellales sp. Tagirdzhanova-0007]
MSYASVASHHVPFGEMPKPDQNLADGHFDGETHSHEDVDSKSTVQVNVLPAGSDPKHPDVHPHRAPHPEPVQLHHMSAAEPHVSEVAPHPAPTPSKGSIQVPQSGAEWEKKNKDIKKGTKKATDKVEKKGEELKEKAKKDLNEAESAVGPYWEKTKDIVLRPGTLGGLMGVVNVGLLSTLGYFAYTRRDQPWDRRIVGGAVAGTLAVFGAEGYVTESYLQTDEGKEEAQRAKKEGSKFYLQAKEVVLRPGVAGGLVGAVNVAVLGTVSYFSYKNWNQPWDRRVISAVTVGLLGLSGLEGWGGKVYNDKELPKR